MNGDLQLVGNTQGSCSTALSASCLTARLGLNSGDANSNNGFSMRPIDVDSDATTTSSSSATLTMPTESVVTFAGLYWGGRSSATDTQRRTIKFRTPGATAYTDLFGTVLDTSTSTDAQYQGFIDVTSLVRTAGSGEYTVANVKMDQASDHWSGWTLVVAYSNPASGKHRINVFDGLQTVSSSATSVSVPVTGLVAPPTTPVGADVGVVAYDGDRGATGDQLRLNGTALSDAQNPVDNIFNSSISRRGTRVTAKNPDYPNQLGHDIDVIAADGLVPANATTASLQFTTGGETILPGVLTFVTDAETDPPDTTITGGPTGTVNTATPSFTFTSTETGSTFQCRVDTGDFADCTSPYTTATLGQGSHTVEVRAIDRAGNIDPTPATRTFTVDTVAPDTTITAGPSGPTNTTTPSFSFTSTETGSTFQCRIDNGTFASCTSPFTTAALTQGSHTIEVRAIDAAGNVDATPATRTFVVDTVAPETTIATGPSGPTNTATPTFTFTSDDANATFECRLDNTGAFTACPASYTTGALSQGAHTLEVRAVDAAGNRDATPATRSFTVDTLAPDTTIATGPTGTVNTTTPTFTFTSDEAGATFECRLDNTGNFAACPTPYTTPTLSQGSHTLEVRAVDAAGNRDASPATRTFIVDTAAPDTTIATGPTGFTNTTTPTFTFTSNESPVTYQCRLDNTGNFTTCPASYTTPTLTQGPHTLEVRAIDAAGNIDATPAIASFVVDTVAPDTTIDTGPTSPTSNNRPTFTFSADQANSTFQCRIDNTGAFTACTSPYQTAALTDGSHTIEVRAIDPAGNVDLSPATRTFVVDTAAPDTTIATGPSGPTNTTTPSFTFTATEAGSTFQCRMDNIGAFTTCPASYTSPALSQGSHTLEVRAVDPAGNIDPTPATRTFTVDTVAPDTTIATGPTGTTGTATPTFTFTSDESGATFECRIDGGTFAACPTPYTTPTLTQGSHTLEVRAVDAAGNRDATPATRTFTVDTVAPDTTIATGPTGPVNTATPGFTFTSDEAGATFECRMDGVGVFVACNTPYTAGPLLDGPHTLEVRAVDAAGNRDATPATRSFTVDTVAPDTTIATGPSGPTNTATPTFTFTSDTTGATYECRLDNTGAFTACPTPYTTATLSQGSHTLEVRAVDAAGNRDGTPATRSFTVDTVAPDTTIATGPTGTVNTASPQFTFTATEAGTFQCRLDNTGAFVPCSTPYTAGPLTDGSHTLEVRAVDAAGNVDASPATRTFTVDTAAPDTTIATGPSGPTNTATPTFTFTATEAGSTFECRLDNTGNFVACPTPYTTTTLSQGEHTLEVRAVDAAGNRDATPATRTFTVDTVAPDTTIATGPTGSISTATPTFTFTSPETGATFQCRIDGGTFAACPASYTTPTLTDGSHTLEVRAVDAAGNVDATPATRTFTVDTAAPDTTIATGPTGPTNTATPSFTFTSNESPVTYECRLDNTGVFTSCNTPYAAGPLLDGPHTLEVRAVDAAGNRDATPATRSFTVDTAAPDTTIATGPSGPTNTTTPQFTFTSPEANVTFECRLDNAATFTACPTPYTTPTLTQGAHTLEVRAVDAAGNRDATPATRSFTVDTVAPDTTIATGPTGPTNTASPQFTFTSETGATFQCRLDNTGVFVPCSSPYTAGPLSEGAHTLEVRAVDTAGNVDQTPATRSFTVDTVVPDTTIATGPTGPTNTATPTFTFTSPEAGVTFECRIDNTGVFAACPTPYTTTTLSQGSHTLEVRAVDAAGNRDASPATRTFTVDTVVPDTVIATGPTGPTNTATLTFTFTSPEAGVTFECRIDGGGAFTACPTPYTTPTLTEGPHTLEVRAVDAAGNRDATPASQSFTVDTVAPDTTIASGPTGPVNTATPGFTFTSDQTGSTFECRMDGVGVFVPCNTPYTAGPLLDGPHTLEVRAVDPAGNRDASPATRSFTVDTNVPDTAIATGPSGPTNTTTPTFTFTSPEANVTFECRLDNTGVFAACPTPYTTPALSQGAHTIEVRAVDAAGNRDATPATQSFTVDTVAPDTTIATGPTGPTNTASPQFTFTSEPGATFQCRLDNTGAFVPCSSPYTAGPLTDGPHTLEVRAIDTAGNVDPTPDTRSFTVDTSPPDTTIATGPSGPTNTATPTFTFTSDQAGSTFECRLDNTGDFTACPTPYTTTTLSQGEHTLEVRAVDAAGNRDATPATRTFVVDTIAPDTTIETGPAGPTNTATPTFTFSSDTTGATYECRLDGTSDFTACPTPYTTPTLTDGEHTLEVRAVDAAGNRDATPATRTFTVDTSAPDTTIATGPQGPTNTATPSFTFTSDDPNATFECRLDNLGDFAPCLTPSSFGPLLQGSHTLEVRAVDAAGNRDASPATRTFVVDTIAPETTITAGPNGPTSDTTPTFEFTSPDTPGATFECRLDGTGDFAACDTPLTTGVLTEGPHTLEVRAVDAAGNRDATPASRSFTVDTAAPETTIDSGPTSPTNDNTPTFTFSANQGGSTFACRLDGIGDFQPCTSPFTTAALTDGEHTLEVRATDPAGNVDLTAASQTFVVDTTPPETSITSGPTGPTNDTTPTFEFASTQAGSTFECRVDGTGDFVPCTSPFTTGELSAGQHYVDVRAIDPAGNVDPTPERRTFTVDTTPPDTTITAGPTGPTNDTTPTFEFTSDKPGSSFACRMDGLGAFLPCDTPYTSPALGQGPHTLEVRAIDTAGNFDATPATRSFTVDTIAPDTTIDSGPDGPTSDATPTFTFSADQTGSTFQCRLDGTGDFAPCDTPLTTTALSEGPHQLEVRAVDPAGNIDPSPAVRSFTVDTQAPNSSIDSGPSGPTNDATPTFTFSADQPGTRFECRVTPATTFTACDSPLTLPALADGTYTLEVRAIDAAGNADPTPATRTFTVDSGVPDTTIDSGPTGTISDTTPTFTFSSNETGVTFSCKLDDADYVPCSSPLTTDNLIEGEHTLLVRATDAAGNTDQSPASRTFTIDTGLPETVISSGPSGPTTDTTPTWAFTSPDTPNATFECRLDTTGDFAACDTPFTAGTLAEGSHTFEVRAVDSAGNRDATPATRTIVVDTTAPQTTIDSGPAGPTNDSTPTFEFSSSQANSTFECRVVGQGDFAPCASPLTIPALADGEYTLEVRATDPAGNVDATPATRTFTVDTSAPDTTITAGPTGTTSDDTPTFEFTADQPGSRFECRIDNADFAPCTSPLTTSTLTDGEHTLQVRAIDPAGNVDGSPASRTFTVDAKAPQTTIDSGPSGPTNDSTPTFTFSSDEAGTFQCRIVGQGDFEPCSSPFTTAALNDGQYTLEVRAVDASGNVDPTPSTRTFTVDTVAPQTTIDTSPTSPTNDNTPTLTFSSSQPGSRFECKIDDADWGECSSPFTTGTLTEGSHTILVRAIDPAGNVDASPASVTFTVDTSAPETSITAGPTGVTADNTPTFEFTSPDTPNATFECRLDNTGEFQPCTSPLTTSALSDGAHTLQVRAVDAAGNRDATPASRQFTIDTGPPDTTITGGPSGDTTDTTPTFEFTADEPARFECRIDGQGDFAPCTSPFTTGALSLGQHTLEVRAIDPQNNVDGTPATRTFTVVAPPAPPSNPPTPPTTPTPPADPVPPSNPTGSSCTVVNGFRTAGLRGSGSSLQIRFQRLVNAKATADIFQVSNGRRVYRERLVLRLRNLTKNTTWKALKDSRGRKVRDGVFFVRLRIPVGKGNDTRRLVAERKNGRWTTRLTHYRRNGCNLLATYKLERPVFGGLRGNAQQISFRVTQTSRVQLEIIRGRGRVVKRFAAKTYKPGRTNRLTFPVRGVPRATYRFRLTVTAGKSKVVAVTAAKLL